MKSFLDAVPSVVLARRASMSVQAWCPGLSANRGGRGGSGGSDLPALGCRYSNAWYYDGVLYWVLWRALWLESPYGWVDQCGGKGADRPTTTIPGVGLVGTEESSAVGSGGVPNRI